MAKLFSGCTSAMFFVLLALAACIMPTSAPTLQTVYVHQATSTAFDLNSGLRLSVSFTCQMIVECMMLTYDSFGCCIPFIVKLLIHSVNNLMKHLLRAAQVRFSKVINTCLYYCLPDLCIYIFIIVLF